MPVHADRDASERPQLSAGPDRHKRYADAVRAGWQADVTEWVDVAVRAVMAVADAEQADLRHRWDLVRQELTRQERDTDFQLQQRLAVEAGWRKVTSALGYGDGITEPQIGFDEFLTEMQQRGRDADEWREHQLWLNDCAEAGCPELEDCYLHDPARIAEANAATLAELRRILMQGGQDATSVRREAIATLTRPVTP